QLLGKSAWTMAWLVDDPRNGQELMLVMPRNQPADAAALERWHQAVRKGTRLNHPQLAHAVEVGEQDRWPFVAYDRANGVTLGERIAQPGPSKAVDLARWVLDALQGLAFAHEAGVAHHDLQLHTLLVSEQGRVRVMGLEIAMLDAAAAAGAGALVASDSGRSLSIDAATLHAQRSAAQRDVLAIGLLMHRLLAGEPALGEADIGRVIDLMPPTGRELVRLPWDVPLPVPDALRVIVNRATDRQERQRYRNARTLARALEGWLDAEAQGGGGPLALLLDRLHSVGHLPAMPRAGARIARLRAMERERTIEMAEFVLQDIGLTFELLRTVNSAQVQGTQVSGNGPVLTIRRAIAMIGLDGMERAVTTLRPWPGPLDERSAEALQAMLERVKGVGLLAQALRPAGYDGEVVLLIALLQNLGRLLVQYHFPDEAAQIRRLMQPMPAEKPEEPPQPGMSEEAASLAVLGVDIESLGAAVARHWGLSEEVLHMIRRLSPTQPVRNADTDDDMLRATASAANEVFDALALPAQLVKRALDRVAQRYARVLNITPEDLRNAIRDSWHNALPEGDAVSEQGTIA
ncbi:MAG TPA: HDOD domain-containing protein, partial [Burkholderiaceae bacterium]|nr:HDOD domain-containing protein [Burkholderiaceae bacterium]